MRFTIVTFARRLIDKSKYPVLQESELLEEFVKGGGPGGSNVNKTVSCVVLKHLPTGTVVKTQSSRLLHENRIIARNLLTNKLDQIYNGEMSVQGQLDKIGAKKSKEHQRKSQKIREMRGKYNALFEDADGVASRPKEEEEPLVVGKTKD